MTRNLSTWSLCLKYLLINIKICPVNAEQRRIQFNHVKSSVETTAALELGKTVNPRWVPISSCAAHMAGAHAFPACTSQAEGYKKSCTNKSLLILLVFSKNETIAYFW